MSNQKRTSQVVLFPLCDPRGAMDEVLGGPESPDTRVNALVLAWRLQLDEKVSVPASAQALLNVIAADPPKNPSERHEALVAELKRISESRGGRSNVEWQRVLRRTGGRSKSVQRKTRKERVIPELDS